MRASGLILPFLCLSLAAEAQSPDLRGLHVGGNNIVNENPKSLAAALTVPGIDGLLLNIGWDQVEPTLGQYSWDVVDQWIAMAISAGRTVTLSVGVGAHTPPWLFLAPPTGAGAKPRSFSISRKGGLSNVCDQETIAAPWDPAFQLQFDAMIAALSAHLKTAGTYNAVILLRLTGINRDTDELHLPAETAQSTGLACVSDSIGTWQQAGYKPSLLLQGWDGITGSFKKSFPDKSFTVALIDSSNPFPPIAEDGSIITFKKGSDISPAQNQPLMMLANQKFPGHLVIQNNSLYPNVPAQPETIQFGQSLGTFTAFQTNEDLATNSGKSAGCGTSFSDAVPCTAATYLSLLETGIFPLGQTNSLRAQYIEVFAADVITYPDDILKAHSELAPPLIALVANAEGEAPVIAANTWVEIKGAALSLTGDSRVWKDPDFVNNQLPKQLDGVSVAVNGKAAYVYYISPSQINILTPPDPIAGPVDVQVTVNGIFSASVKATAQAIAPSFFVFNGGPYVAATHANGTLLMPGTPAKPGEVVVLYANGFGPTSTPVISGSISQSGALSPLPTIKIAGTTAVVQFAGLITPGLYQFNVVIPPSTPDGDAPVQATYNNSTTQPATLLPIQH